MLLFQLKMVKIFSLLSMKNLYVFSFALCLPSLTNSPIFLTNFLVLPTQSVPDVSKALYASSLSLTPQVLSPTTLKVPIPKPDWEKRQELVRKAGEICENGRVLIRSIRGKGMKDIKTDVDMKVVGKEGSRGEVKKVRVVQRLFSLLL